MEESVQDAFRASSRVSGVATFELHSLKFPRSLFDEVQFSGNTGNNENFPKIISFIVYYKSNWAFSANKLCITTDANVRAEERSPRMRPEEGEEEEEGELTIEQNQFDNQGGSSSSSDNSTHNESQGDCNSNRNICDLAVSTADIDISVAPHLHLHPILETLKIEIDDSTDDSSADDRAWIVLRVLDDTSRPAGNENYIELDYCCINFAELMHLRSISGAVGSSGSLKIDANFETCKDACISLTITTVLNEVSLKNVCSSKKIFFCPLSTSLSNNVSKSQIEKSKDINSNFLPKTPIDALEVECSRGISKDSHGRVENHTLNKTEKEKSESTIPTDSAESSPSAIECSDCDRYNCCFTPCHKISQNESESTERSNANEVEDLLFRIKKLEHSRDKYKSLFRDSDEKIRIYISDLRSEIARISMEYLDLSNHLRNSEKNNTLLVESNKALTNECNSLQGLVKHASATISTSSLKRAFTEDENDFLSRTLISCKLELAEKDMLLAEEKMKVSCLQKEVKKMQSSLDSLNRHRDKSFSGLREVFVLCQDSNPKGIANAGAIYNTDMKEAQLHSPVEGDIDLFEFSGVKF